MIEKILVDEFEILENNGTIGINFPLTAEPIDTAEFIYDGRNCGILLRNEKEAYIFTNILPNLRQLLLNAPEIMFIESKGEDIINSYMAVVTKVPEIPLEDTLTEELKDTLEEIKEIYGDEGIKLIAEKLLNKD